MGAHIVISSIAILIGGYLAFKLGNWKLILIQILSVGALWYYSTLFKKQVLIGNIVVALLAALVPLVAGLYELVLQHANIDSTVNALLFFLEEGTPFKDAVYRASMSRFRPILLTSITTVAGLMPIVLETSLQAQFLIPMAISLAYGLAAATFIMLLILPPMLIAINNGRRLWRWLWEGEYATAEEVEPSVLEEHNT